MLYWAPAARVKELLLLTSCSIHEISSQLWYLWLVHSLLLKQRCARAKGLRQLDTSPLGPMCSRNPELLGQIPSLLLLCRLLLLRSGPDKTCPCRAGILWTVPTQEVPLMPVPMTGASCRVLLVDIIS